MDVVFNSHSEKYNKTSGKYLICKINGQNRFAREYDNKINEICKGDIID